MISVKDCYYKGGTCQDDYLLKNPKRIKNNNPSITLVRKNLFLLGGGGVLKQTHAQTTQGSHKPWCRYQRFRDV